MLYNLLPNFKIVEINNVAALRMGHVIAQTPAYVSGEGKALIASKTVGDYKFVENGVIVGLDQTNVLANYDASKHSQPCLVYTEELITANLLSGLDQFANQADVNGEVYVRALPLNLGDTFTTNNVSGTIVDGFAKVVNGVITMEAAASADTLFIVKKSTLPTGIAAAECIYCGKVVAATTGTDGE